MPTGRTIRVAAAQLPGLPLAEADRSLALIDQAIDQAAARGTDLLVVPECAYPAYYLGGADVYRRASLLSSEQFVAHLAEKAAARRIHLVCGLVEDTGSALYNSAVAIDAAGRECGRVRKSFLWGDDNRWFTPGDRVAPIDMPIGRIGVLICADGRAPEIAAGLVAQGAELIVIPTCWVNVAPPGKFFNAQAEFMIEGRALECRVPFVAANKFGRETDHLSYCGWSMILDADAATLAKAPPDEPALIDAEITLAPPAPRAMPAWALERVVANDAPVTGPANRAYPLKIAVVPSQMLVNSACGAASQDLLARLAADGAQVVGTALETEELAERIEVYGHSLGIAVIGFPFVERLMIERFGAFACISTEHVYDFAATRAMALDGAAIVFVAGDPVPLPLLRTRAAENRMFIAAASPTTAALVAPTGKIIGSVEQGSEAPVVAEIDLTESADKQVFDMTNVWEQRRPSAYAAAFPKRGHH